MTIEITLQPKQKLAFEKSFTTPVLFYGGSKGSGKSYLVRSKEAFLRLKYPNTRGLIVRKTYPELLSNHIRMFFREYPETRKWYNKAEKAIYYPNGSITEFSYLKNTDDVYTYQGREYENISVDEITQHEEEVFKILRTSLRTANPELKKQGFTPTMLLTGNPGGIGHQWVKRVFIDKNFRKEENPADFDFVQAFVWDNQALLKADPEYLKRLDDLPDHLRRAYKEGDWNVHAGMAFSELSRDKHIIKPFTLPAGTRYFAGYDHGFNHPFSFILCAITPEGSVYVVKRLHERLKRPDEIAELIKTYCEGLRVEIHAGPDIWSRQRDGGPTVAEQLYNCGLTPAMGFVLVKGKDNREQGVAELRKYLAWKNRPNEESILRFFENTKDVYDCVASMQFDSRRPEDVLKIDADENGVGGDDDYDALRYAIMSRVKTPEPVKKDYPNDSLMKVLDSALDAERRARDIDMWI